MSSSRNTFIFRGQIKKKIIIYKVPYEFKTIVLLIVYAKAVLERYSLKQMYLNILKSTKEN